MILRVLGSGSKGNSYVLLSKQTTLLIECGLPYRNHIMRVLGHERSRMVGILISHKHKDHFGYLETALKDGLDAYMPQECYNITRRNMYAHVPPLSHPTIVGDFAIMPFELVHDAECYGYLISHPEMGITLFATDTGYIPQDFSTYRFSHIMIECNYSEDIMRQRMEAEPENVPHYKHVMKGHLSLESVIDYLSKLDLCECEDILLMHLSDGNSNEREFVEKVQKAFPRVRVNAAKAGLHLNYNKKIYIQAKQ